MSHVPFDPVENPSVTPWDRRVVGAMNVAASARAGAVVLQVIAVVVAAAAVLGNVLFVFAPDVSGSSNRIAVGQFLGGVAAPLAFAGMVYGLSCLLAVAAARLDLDIVLADGEETGRTDER